MRFNLPYAAVGLALALGAPAAHARTVITTQPAPAVIAQPRMVTVPPVVQPVETIQTIQTVRTVRAAPSPSLHAALQPLYDVAPAAVALYDAAPAPVPPAPVYGYSSYGYSTPVYDVAPAAVAPAPVIAAPVATQPIIYRYVYEPDRILVIDPATNIAVQAIPR